MPVDIHKYSNGRRVVVAPVVAGVAVAARLFGKPAWELAKKLATKYMKARDKGKAKIITEAKDKGIAKQFSEIKSGMLKKANKGKPKSKVSKNPTHPVESMFIRDQAARTARAAAKRKRLESVGGYNRARQEAKDAGTSYGMKKGGSVKKYAMGGGIRKANYK